MRRAAGTPNRVCSPTRQDFSRTRLPRAATSPRHIRGTRKNKSAAEAILSRDYHGHDCDQFEPWQRWNWSLRSPANRRDFQSLRRRFPVALARRACVRYPAYMAQSKLPEDLEQRLLALAPADRLALAARLLASVEGAYPDRDEAWSAELDRRDAQFDSGSVVGIPAAEVHASARARLRARSAKP